MSSFVSHPLYPGDGIPIFISAGPIKEEGQLLPFLNIEDPKAAPVITEGGFTLPEWLGNAEAGQTDFVYYPDRKMAGNCRGLPNLGKEGMRSLARVNARLAEIGIKTIVQVTNLPHEKPIDVIPDMVEAALECNATAVEVNLSCPNGKKDDGSLHPPLCNDADECGEVMAASRAVAGRDACLGAKDSPHITGLEDKVDEIGVANLAVTLEEYLDFVTAINTIGNQPFAELECGGGRGGMSGPVVADIARQHLQIWKRYAPDLAYLSCGGVDSENVGFEVPERLRMGALLVGGAQEFYRAAQPHLLSARWAQEL